MNAATVLVLIIAWGLIGLLSGVWMARRGYDPLWILLAVPLGPLFFPIAVERVRRRPGFAGPAPASGTPPPDAGPRVLIGLDGSPESEQTLATALRMLGSQCSLLVLAEVVHYEAAEDTDRVEMDAAARRLRAAAAPVDITGPVRTEVLVGAPGSALREFAEREGIDILVVGRRGRGLSRHLLGSVSNDLVTHSTVPVLVVEPPHPVR
ncbi:universal stress protein [Mycolicibacterium xanthum]|uniref:universal stress protein n=1 Tax=Mycolicibacterium xanthum TaxID=2796469 RepID=UPI0027DF41DF|nr:universal stress protein [Mycolicibacterium xanthum]